MARELERKFVVKGPRVHSIVDQHIKEALALRSTNIISGLDLDMYWNSPGVDFIRLRKDGDGGTATLTAKLTDRGTIQDRQEEEIRLPHFNAALDYTLLVHGDPIGEVTKSFTKFHVDKFDYWAEVATYRVLPDKRIFLEVESESVRGLDILCNLLEQALVLEPCPHSVFEMFIKNGGVQ